MNDLEKIDDAPPEAPVEDDGDDDDDDFVYLNCSTCGIEFGFAKALSRFRQIDGGWFYCPNGHQNRYETHKEIAEQLQEARTETLIAKSKAEQLEAKLDGRGWKFWK